MPKTEYGCGYNRKLTQNCPFHPHPRPFQAALRIRSSGLPLNRPKQPLPPPGEEPWRPWPTGPVASADKAGVVSADKRCLVPRCVLSASLSPTGNRRRSRVRRGESTKRIGGGGGNEGGGGRGRQPPVLVGNDSGAWSDNGECGYPEGGGEYHWRGRSGGGSPDSVTLKGTPGGVLGASPTAAQYTAEYHSQYAQFSQSAPSAMSAASSATSSAASSAQSARASGASGASRASGASSSGESHSIEAELRELQRAVGLKGSRGMDVDQPMPGLDVRRRGIESEIEGERGGWVMIETSLCFM